MPRVAEKPIAEAVWEWASSALVGAIPLAAHFVAVAPRGAAEIVVADFVPDILFVAIAMSGASMVSLIPKLRREILPVSALGPSVGGLMALNLVLVVGSAAMYGTAVTETPSMTLFLTGLAFLIGSALNSLSIDVVIATANGKTPH
ncbi:MAG: hypothetical protein QM773_13450 [Hyphomonadaceae bacterium]